MSLFEERQNKDKQTPQGRTGIYEAEIELSIINTNISKQHSDDFENYRCRKQAIDILHREIISGDNLNYAKKQLAVLQASVPIGKTIPFEYGVYGPDPCFWCNGTLIWDGDPEDIELSENRNDNRGACIMCSCLGLEKIYYGTYSLLPI